MNAGISPNNGGRTINQRTTVADLVEELGPRILTQVGPLGEGIEVAGTEFLDISDELPDAAGTLFLVPSTVSFTATRVEALAETAAAHGAAGLVVKCTADRLPEFAAIAESTGLPFVRVTDRISWRLLDAHLTHLLGETEVSIAGPHDRRAEPLFAVANELAEFFGGSVAIEDVSRNILAYSSVPGQLIDSLRTLGILARHVPASPRNDDQYRSVLRSDQPIKFPRLDDEEARVAFTIRAGALPLGTIWAIDASGDRRLTRAQEERIRRASALAGVHLLEDLRVNDISQRPRVERLRTLLTGIDLTGTEFAELGIDQEQGAVLLAFDVPDAGPAITAHLRSTVVRHLSLQRADTVAIVHRGRLYALFAEGSVETAVSLIEPLLPLTDRLVAEGARIAVAGPAHHSGDVGATRLVADQLLDTAKRGSRTRAQRVLTVERLRPQLLIDRANELLVGAEELRDPAIDALMASEKTQPIAETILIWLECFGNTAQAADRLGVHENTVRYRLQRAREFLGIKFEHGDERLAAWLQLRTLSLS
jgi:hypothetical protein